ncbi:IS200/IS605 family transposase [soil metagenome]
MPSTHTSLYFHLVFSTKDRLPLIGDDWKEKLHAYLGGIVRNQKGVALAVGGIDNHVHLLVSLKATHCLSDVMRELKASSSGWVHREIGLKEFAWQVGYGAFTVSPNNLERVKNYVLNQERHHQKETFESEYVEILKASGVEYDEKYLW